MQLSNFIILLLRYHLKISRRSVISAPLYLAVLIMVVSLLSPGCVKIPSQLFNEEAIPGNKTNIFRAAVCGKIHPFSEQKDTERQNTTLDSSGFRLLNWNIYKGRKEGWQKNLQEFARESDLLILQEGYLVEDLRGLLESHQFYWVVAVAFEYKDIISGVLTASRVEPSFSCSFRKPEPLLRIPKTALVTLYPLSDNDETLLVANIHMINFTLGGNAFRSQLETLRQILLQHHGPLIIAGDFNTWSDKRCAIVDAVFSNLNLQEVIFLQDSGSCRFGKTVDRVYYRGLEIIDTDFHHVKSSDHNPMIVTFKLKNNFTKGLSLIQ